MSNAESVVGSRLDADRRDLLDLSLRNPLLNFRPRSRSLELVGESPAQLFRALVRDGKRMTFLPAPDPASSADGFEFRSDQTDLKLQTTLSADLLQSRLLAIFYAARTAIEEQGVNTLFLALGMLHWSADDAPAKTLRAPLLLLPVELDRSSARERFRLRATEDDAGHNLSLASKLQTDFRINLPEAPDEDGLDVDAYLDRVAEAIGDRPGWSVGRDAVVLGFFSFGKFLMYRDLDEANWPEGSKPREHPIVRALLADGFREPAPTVGEDELLDRHLSPADAHHIVDADSTQALALLDADRGRNLVIQGPPGTGKSQTITNLIAEAIGRGKSVLFVSEKMAALEVVKRRLDAAGLGDACLELHSQKTNKRALIDELRRTLSLGPPRLGPIDDDLRMLVEARDRLNAYAEAVNTPVGDSGVTPHETIGELLRLRDPEQGPAPPLEIPDMASWTRYDLKRRQALVEELEARLANLGVPAGHPFWGARRASLPPTEGDRLRVLVRAAWETTSALREAAARLARFLRLPSPSNRAEAETILRAARRAKKAAQVHGTSGTNATSGDWLAHRGEIEELLESGKTLSEIHHRRDPDLLPDAWEQDLAETRRDLNTHGRSFWRFFSGSYRRARRRVAALCRAAPPRGLDDQLAMVDDVLAARRHREAVQRHAELAARLFDVRWKGERSNWEALGNLARSVIQLHQDVRAGRLPSGILDFVADHPPLEPMEPMAEALKAALATHAEALARLVAFLEFETAEPVEARAFDDQARLLATWAERAADLPALVAFNNLAGRCRTEGLAPVVAIAETWPEASHRIVESFRRHGFESLLADAFRQRPALSAFDGPGHEHAIRTFAGLDRLALRHNRARLAHLHWRKLPRHEAGGQLGTLRREFEKKSRHMSIRQLMARAGNAVRAIKPVFMMSPLSIAAYLAPGSLHFDLVVFDEASQVKPVDALGAILRGRQAVVVGDSRQLPPTSFFDRLTAGDDDPDDDDASNDVESILGLFVAQGAPERMLRWHYRSRHESLIAVSNREFYDGRLVVFPSPDLGRQSAGLIMRHLPETTYDRGQTRANAGEAEAVARAVIEHARAQLDRAPGQRQSLGVAAFSLSQMQAIRDRLELLRRDEPACEPFFATSGPEPFFVKNLENVQGDERDVIFISVGYGRTAGGEVAMSFGPLNGDGGERRLNVLITRARVRCEVFTNLSAADIDLGRTRARGVRALKTFLAYAEGVTRPAPDDREVAPAGPFEQAVIRAISDAGHQVRFLGKPGSALDLAVVDPDETGRYRLGIVSDGPTYAEPRSARDRDRLRPQVLEALGWKLRHAWSTDWARDPEGELARVLAAIDETKEIEQERPPEPPAPDDPAFERDGTNESTTAGTGVPPYRLASLAGGSNGTEAERLAAWVVEVVRVEGPVHVGEVARRVAEASGVSRVGDRLRSEVERAFSRAEQGNEVVRRGDFLWPGSMERPPVRDRSTLPTASRKLDLVAPEEIAEAIGKAVVDALGMAPDAIPRAACRLLGFDRTSDEMRARIGAIVEEMVGDGRLVSRGDHLTLQETVPDPV